MTGAWCFLFSHTFTVITQFVSKTLIITRIYKTELRPVKHFMLCNDPAEFYLKARWLFLFSSNALEMKTMK